MEETVKKPVASIKDGSQVIALIGQSEEILDQKFLLIRDKDDRKTGTGILKYGLSGGGIEKDKDETPLTTGVREFEEESGEKIDPIRFELFGCYLKKRPNGLINNNYLWITLLDSKPKEYITNDPDEVSEVRSFTLSEILNLALKDCVHEGSIRLIFNFLNGTTSGSLNEPVTWNGFTF